MLQTPKDAPANAPRCLHVLYGSTILQQALPTKPIIRQNHPQTSATLKTAHTAPQTKNHHNATQYSKITRTPPQIECQASHPKTLPQKFLPLPTIIRTDSPAPTASGQDQPVTRQISGSPICRCKLLHSVMPYPCEEMAQPIDRPELFSHPLVLRFIKK